MSTPPEYLGQQVVDDEINAELDALFPETAPVQPTAPTSDIIVPQEEEEERTWAQVYFDTLGDVAKAAVPGLGMTSSEDISDVAANFGETAVNELYTLYDPRAVGQGEGADFTDGNEQPITQALSQGIVKSGIILGAGAAATPLGVAAAVGATVQGVRRQIASVEEDTNQRVLNDTGVDATPEQKQIAVNTALPYILGGQTLDTITNIIPVGYFVRSVGATATKPFLSLVNKIPGVQKITPEGANFIAGMTAVQNLGKNWESIARYTSSLTKTAALEGVGEMVEETGSQAGALLGSGQAESYGQAITQAAQSPETLEAGRLGFIAGAGIGSVAYSPSLQKNKETPEKDLNALTKGAEIVAEVEVSPRGELTDPVKKAALDLTNTIAHLENPASSKTEAFIPASSIDPNAVKEVVKNYPNMLVEDVPGPTDNDPLVGVIISHDPKLLNSTERTIASKEKRRSDLLEERSQLDAQLRERDEEIFALEKQQDRLFAARRELEKRNNLRTPRQLEEDPGAALQGIQEEQDITTQLEDTKARLEQLQGMDDIAAKQAELQRITQEMTDLISMRNNVSPEQASDLESQITELETSQKVLQQNYAQDPRSSMLERIAQIDTEVASINSLLTAGDDLDVFRSAPYTETRTAQNLDNQVKLIEQKRSSLQGQVAYADNNIAKAQEKIAALTPKPVVRLSKDPETGEDVVTEVPVAPVGANKARILAEQRKIARYTKQKENALQKIADTDTLYNELSQNRVAAQQRAKAANEYLQKQPSSIYKDVYTTPIRNDADLNRRVRLEKQRKESILQELQGTRNQRLDLERQQEAIAQQQLEGETTLMGEPTSPERGQAQLANVVQKDFDKAALYEDIALLQNQEDILNSELARIDNFLNIAAENLYQNSGIRNPVPSSYDPLLASATELKNYKETYGENAPYLDERIIKEYNNGAIPAAVNTKNTSSMQKQAANTRPPAALNAINKIAAEQSAQVASEQAKTNTDPKKAFMSIVRGNFTALRNLPVAVRDAILEGRYSMEAAYKEIEYNVRNVANEVKRLKKEGTDIPISTLNAALVRDDAGVAALQSLPDNLRKHVDAMRTHIRSLSQDLIKSGMLSSNLIGVFNENLDVYLNRSYKIFDDPEWLVQVKQNVPLMERFFAHMQNYTPRAPNEPEADYIKRLRNTSMDFLDGIVGLDADGKPSVHSMAALLSFQTSDGSDTNVTRASKILTKRKDIDPILLEVMGVKDNLYEQYIDTARKQAALLHGWRSLAQIKTVLLDKGMISKGRNEDAGHTTPIPTKNSALSPLNEYYTTPEFSSAYTSAYERAGKDANLLMQMAVAGSAISKVGATVITYSSQVRNLIGAHVQASINSNIADLLPGTASWRDTVATVLFGQFDVQGNYLVEKGFLDSKKYAERRDNFLKMLKAGLIQSFDARYMEEVYKDLVTSDNAEQYLGKIQSRMENIPGFSTGKEVTVKGIKAAFKLYSAADAIAKGIVWKSKIRELSERAQYKERLRSEDDAVRNAALEEVEMEAARITRDVMASYDLSPKAVEQIRRFPFAAPFISFSAEVVRNTKNTISYASKDMRSADPVARTQGSIAMAKTLGTLSALSMSSMVSAFTSGIEDEEESAVRMFMPSYHQLSNVVHEGKKDGVYSYFDLDSVNPFAIVTNPVTGILDALFDEEKSVSEAFQDSLYRLLQPVLQEDIFTGRFYEAFVTGRDSTTGDKIYDPNNDPEWAFKAAAHVLGAFNPGIARDIDRLVKGWNEESDKSGNRMNFLDALITTMSGMRSNKVDVPKAFYAKVSQYASDKENASKNLMKAVLTKATMSDKDVKKAVDEYKILRTNMNKSLIDYIKAAQRTGVDEFELREKLSQKNISSSDIESLMNYEVPPMEISETIQDTLMAVDNNIPEGRLEQVESALGGSIYETYYND